MTPFTNPVGQTASYLRGHAVLYRQCCWAFRRLWVKFGGRWLLCWLSRRARWPHRRGRSRYQYVRLSNLMLRAVHT